MNVDKTNILIVNRDEKKERLTVVVEEKNKKC